MSELAVRSRNDANRNESLRRAGALITTSGAVATVDHLAQQAASKAVKHVISTYVNGAKQAVGKTATRLYDNRNRNSQQKIDARQERSNAPKNRPKAVMSKAISNNAVARAAVPAGRAYVTHTSGARMWSAGGTTVRIKHTEQCATLTSGPTSDFTLRTPIQLNPTDANTFPWLSSIAHSYQNFRFHNVKLSFVPACSTSQPGLVGMAYESDPNSRDYPGDSVEFSAYIGAKRSVPWQSDVMHVPKSGLQLRKTYTIETHFSSSMEMFCCAGQLLVSTEGTTPEALLGQLMISYEIELDLPTHTTTLPNSHHYRAQLESFTFPANDKWRDSAVQSSKSAGVTKATNGFWEQYTIHSSSAGKVFLLQMTSYDNNASSTSAGSTSPFTIINGTVIDPGNSEFAYLGLVPKSVSVSPITFTSGDTVFGRTISRLVQVPNDSTKPSFEFRPQNFWPTSGSGYIPVLTTLTISEPVKYSIRPTSLIIPFKDSVIDKMARIEEITDEDDSDFPVSAVL